MSTSCTLHQNLYSRLQSIILILVFLPSVINASGRFEFRFDSFDNPMSRDEHGICCSNSSVSSSSDFSSSCSGHCRVYFRVCLKHYQNVIDTDSPCTFGEVTTPVLGNDRINDPGYTVPIAFNFSWPKTLSYIVDIGHESFEGAKVNPNSRNRLIYQFKAQTELAVGSEWTIKSAEVGGRSKAKLRFATRVICSDNYYGDQCSSYCRSRDDDHGHFFCTDKGKIVCLPGWEGIDNYCKTPTCLPGCDREHGFCDQPNECKCRFGWEGPDCKKCQTYPGCQHGSCLNNTKPFTCVCEEGWGGIFCNQDLNFCTNHRPCKNGGTCYNSGQGSYTCVCPLNFSGKNCDVLLKECDFDPCKNGGTCFNSGLEGSHTCVCPPNFTGKSCETSLITCDHDPCRNGGSCFDDGQGSYTCVCPPNFTGRNCEAPGCGPDQNCEINQQDNCIGVVCENGGVCRDGIGDYTCKCKPGYSGRHCQTRVDLCRGFPCANGGTCIDSPSGDFTCACTPGFTGKHCSVDIDDCDPNPCLNGAKCKDGVNEFICLCPPGLFGPTCQSNANHTIKSGKTSSPSQNFFLGSSSSRVNDKDENGLIISGVMITIIAIISTLISLAIVMTYLIFRRRKLEKDRERDEQLARSQNEENSRSLILKKKCLDKNDPFKGHMIVNTLTDNNVMDTASSIHGYSSNKSTSSNYSSNLNRDKSLALSKSMSKLTNYDYECNLKLAGGKSLEGDYNKVKVSLNPSSSDSSPPSSSKPFCKKLKSVKEKESLVVTRFPHHTIHRVKNCPRKTGEPEVVRCLQQQQQHRLSVHHPHHQHLQHQGIYHHHPHAQSMTRLNVLREYLPGHGGLVQHHHQTLNRTATLQPHIFDSKQAFIV